MTISERRLREVIRQELYTSCLAVDTVPLAPVDDHAERVVLSSLLLAQPIDTRGLEAKHFASVVHQWAAEILLVADAKKRDGRAQLLMGGAEIDHPGRAEIDQLIGELAGDPVSSPEERRLAVASVIEMHERRRVLRFLDRINVRLRTGVMTAARARARMRAIDE